jgi:tetratricopeptide (TPR) repeat protein
MDKLDKISIFAIVILIVSVTFLVVVYAKDTQYVEQFEIRQVARPFNPELDQKVKVAKGLLENNNLQKAEKLIAGLIREYPYDGAPYMAKGDLYLRKQDPRSAMLAYKSGIDFNPDYLDKKTKDFQGKKVKVTVLEAKKLIDRELKENPGNSDLKQQRKTVFYMLRRLAGSCG